MFRDLVKIAAGFKIYHHSQHVDRSNARKASGKSAFSYEDLKGLRKLAFWLFVFSIFLNWGTFGGIMLTSWIVMWAVSLLF
ncbi:hypothetical protein ACZ99_16165 [Lactobacillus sp. ATCC 15578]|nr:hypothetical protein [Lactiplantibacillus plantarum subsp. plantarum]PNW61867.1 hypothetical protein ACZ99_16165 [Lactobacillus sp. ATCC 15578]